MSAPASECPHGHQIHTNSDRDARGYCRACKRQGERDRRIANRAALDVVKIFEAAGVVFQAGGVPRAADVVAHELAVAYGG